MNFVTFKQAVAAKFAKMKGNQLFRTAISGDQLWDTYLTAFPEGTNPVYRERTEYDCSCCRNFIRNIGNVVAIDSSNNLVSIWDVTIPEEPAYQVVANALSARVKSSNITNIFLHFEKQVGKDKDFEQMLSGEVQTWNHFHVQLPSNAIMHNRDIPTKLGEIRSRYDVMKRGIETLSFEAIDTVLELISQNSLYRGAEFKTIINDFRALKTQVTGYKLDKHDNAIWKLLQKTSPAVATIRNSAIGTLLVDLSEGKELEQAVAAFERMVAPTNYKRPTALVTKSMIENAKKKIEELGLMSALERRYAHLGDITINNVLFANRSTRKAMGDVFTDLANAQSVDAKHFSKVEEVTVEKFLNDILPTASSVELLVENKHAGNFVSLIAPNDPTAPNLFKWNNGFSWSYAGNLTDSIKERVKQAGGNVTAELCCRLAWDYSDDLDFHMHEPGNSHIDFSNRRRLSLNGGMLDVDANGGDGIRENPVENIYYEHIKTMRPGNYELSVHNFSRRSQGTGFEIEIELQGQVTNLVYEKVIRDDDTVRVATIQVEKNGNATIHPKLPSTIRSKQIWNVNTQTFIPVNAIMRSPNYWDEQQGIGNEHIFFMLEGCENPDTARGFYNEFLRSEFNEHRKVMEMVGTKMHAESAKNQLSGLGFSTTQRNNITLRVSGAMSRVIRVTF